VFRVVGSGYLNIAYLKVLWLSRLVSGMSSWIFEFDPRSVLVVFVVDTVSV
jgi:hypothetical protein